MTLCSVILLDKTGNCILVYSRRIIVIHCRAEREVEKWGERRMFYSTPPPVTKAAAPCQMTVGRLSLFPGCPLLAG
jgi:hypothetical protein